MEVMCCRALIAAAVALIGLCTSRPVAAQGDEDAVALALFQQGRQLMAEGRIAEACQRFAQSQKSQPKLGTLLNLAHCHEQDGKTATAWAEFTEAATVARRGGQQDRAAFALERKQALQSILSRVNVTGIEADDEARVTIGGVAAVAGTPLPVDPGKVTVTVAMPGKRPWSTEVDVPAGPTTVEVPVPPLQDAPAERPAPAAPVPGPDVPAPPQPPPSDEIPAALWVGVGVAGAGLVVGVITGAVSWSLTSDLQQSCTDGLCPPSEADNKSTANTLANVSNVSFAVAGTGAIVAIVGVLLWQTDDADESAVSLVPHGDVGMALRVPF